MPRGALAMLGLRFLQSSRFHGYVIARRIHNLSNAVLEVEEGSFYPSLQRMVMEAGSQPGGASPRGGRVCASTH